MTHQSKFFGLALGAAMAFSAPAFANDGYGDCKLFGNVCTPDNPMGACMVSSEGACAAHYAYGRHRAPTASTEASTPTSGPPTSAATTEPHIQ